jgi:membrane protein implicated in regulation of membrane protease activity
MNSVYWLIILAIFILIEIITLGITTIWFAGGALVAFIISLFYDNPFLEVVLFLVISMSLLCFTRPLVVRYFKHHNTKANQMRVIGKIAMVDSTIDQMNAVGQVILDGKVWSAKSLEGNIVEKGTSVKIQGISGTNLIVSVSKDDSSKPADNSRNL